MPTKFSQAAVLTADIVHSRRIPAKALDQRLNEVARLIEVRLLKRKNVFEIYRGDSFQAIIQAEDALKVALLWRAAMKATPGKYSWDIRVAIGFGTVSHWGKTLAASGGDAFQHSGTLLDDLKHNANQLIAFYTNDEARTAAINTECMLAEGLISRWTTTGAETVFNALLYNDTQDGLAERMGVSQPAIHKRLQVASWPAIRHWEGQYRKTAAQFIGVQSKVANDGL